MMWTLREEEEVRVTPSFWLEQSGERFYYFLKRAEWSECKLGKQLCVVDGGPLRNAWGNVEQALGITGNEITVEAVGVDEIQVGDAVQKRASTELCGIPTLKG